ncbi:T9SS type A sorting domain-containing protein [uncultured Psychroserpens sp.]|uniref:DUF7619 domain-containing protein n=1 Tax=uncultured Psychroserpens sp. TaxID=255436 RepID=UPI00262DD004|nr:T9SS type A sorting domain-containing protein [uncultured Psychroserpens sp.]
MKKNYIFLLGLFAIFICNSQTISIPDPILKSELINYIPIIDSNGDGEIQTSEAELITDLNIAPTSGIINSIEGLESFTNLVDLSLSNGNFDTILEFQNYSYLETLHLGNFSFPDLNLTNLISLRELRLFQNQNTNFNALEFNSCNCDNLESLYLTSLQGLSTIDLSDRTNLNTLDLFGIELEALDISNTINLQTFRLFDTNITELDFNLQPNLQSVEVEEQMLNVLNVSNNPNLSYVKLDGATMDILDFSNNINLNVLLLFNLNVGFLNVKNGTVLQEAEVLNVSVDYICIDEALGEEIDFESLFSNDDNVIINTYCSFTPGGEFNSIEGSVRIDNDDNGCDLEDYVFPYLKLNINSFSSNVTYITDSSGQYNVYVYDGDYTITPILENSTFFNVDPNTPVISFPTEISPYVQDFCLTSTGNSNDLEISVVPLDQARPGFESTYKILYKNIGNTILFGSVDFDFSFDSDYLQYVSSIPDINGNINSVLSWDYTSLLPLETREILVTMQLNTPTDSNFPLNSGDELNYVATIYPIENDETPNSNDSGLKQIVVNSFDPNDIICLEGEAITPESVGEYIHYLIRFENLGTANATNVVVKDAIDPTKFDINTLIPLDGSHTFYTRINENYDVEFIFENINLPFDDVNNDGYLVFKIKTLNTLVLGDEFSNQAEIYFDFNAPIVTNNYTTTVAEENLSVLDQQLASIEIFPNPTSDKLYIKSDEVLKSAKVYDVNGRTVLNFDLSNTQTSINIDSLKTGVYFLKVNYNTGTKTVKLIKK